jgi:hypothetical protein
MYSFAQRKDTQILDEPLYGHYLRVSGAEHPGREEIMAAMNCNGDEVMAELTEESEFIRNNVPDFWWVYLYLVGVSPFIAFGLPLVLVGIGGFAAFKVTRVAAERGETKDEYARDGKALSSTG